MLNLHDLERINYIREHDNETYQIIEKMEQDFLKLASRACHDILNSVALIDSYCQLMNDRYAQLADDPMWNKISKNTHLQIKQLNDISAFRYSYNTSGREEFALSELIDQLTDDFAPALQVSLTNAPETICGVKNTILYSLKALIENAVDAHTGTDCSILLEIRELDGCLHFTITDNGCGFSQAEPDNPWEPFFTTKKNHTGLGMSTAYNTAIHHGGELSIKNLCQPTVVDFSIKI